MEFDVVIFTDNKTENFPEPFRFRPFGAWRVADELRKHGYHVMVIDFFADIVKQGKITDVVKKYVTKNTKMVGYSSTLMGYNIYGLPLNSKLEILEVINNHIKTVSPNVKICYGGTKSLALENSIKNSPKNFNLNFDFIVHGLADTSVVELMEYITNKKMFPIGRTVNGVRIVEHDVKASRFDFRNSIQEYQPHDLIVDGESLSIETARGCIFRCAFCSYPLLGKNKNDMSYYKTVDCMAQEMRTNYQNYKTVNYSIVDDTFNERTDKIVNLIKARDAAKVDATFVSYIRIDLVERYPEQMKLLKELNLRGMFFGIETFNHEAGKIIGKGLHPDRTKEILYEFKEVFPTANFTAGFITGLPGESISDFMRTVEWLERDDCPIESVSVTGLNFYDDMAYGKSLFTENPEKYGIDLKKFSAKGWTYKIANDLAKKINKMIWLKKTRIGAWASLGLCNLGYSFDETLRPKFYTPNKFLEVQTKYNNFKKNYIEKLLS